MGKTVLVVDDSPSMRQMVAHTLASSGFAVVEGGDGADALKKLAAQPVQLIITDLNMPVMDGISFIKEVRAQPKYKFTPVLMLTTESQASRKQEGRAAGATGWLVKPFHPEQLLATVKKVLP